jgi:transposase-like protein
MMEEAQEAKVRDLLGREYYERGEGERCGYRNGSREGRLKTSEGEVHYASPQVRDVDAKELASLRALIKDARNRWRRWQWRCMRGAALCAM